MFALYTELRRHNKLAEQRSPMFESNRFAKFWMYFMALFWIGYLIFFGTMFAFAMDGGSTEPYHVMNAGFIFVMVIDFMLRFAFQKTPTQEMKPYILLPVRKNRLIDLLLLRSGMNGYNLLWLFFYVPFGILTVTRFYGVWGVVTYSAGIWLLMLFNNYWWLICRSLMSERVWWLLLPVGVYALLGCALFIPEESPLFDWSTDLGEGFIQGHGLTFIGMVAAIIVLVLINRLLMQRMVYAEISKVEETTEKVGKVSEYRFFDRFGEIGEYMRLELKLYMRNKMTKKMIYMIVAVVLLFSLMLSFSDTYTGRMREFFILYNFIICAIQGLSGLMAYEGNYIDGLMSRKESIYALLRAKYYMWSVVLLFPFVMSLPAVFTGKITLLSCVAWLIFVPGPVYFMLFQLAVLNKKTLNLNAKITNRQNVGTGLQNLIAAGAFFVPFLISQLLTGFFDETTASLILIAMGLLFIATSNLWLRNIYQRFMKRRYENMEGFRDSRQK